MFEESIYTIEEGCFEIFRMNTETILEFGFRMIRRIMQTSEAIIHRG